MADFMEMRKGIEMGLIEEFDKMDFIKAVNKAIQEGWLIQWDTFKWGHIILSDSEEMSYVVVIMKFPQAV